MKRTTTAALFAIWLAVPAWLGAQERSASSQVPRIPGQLFDVTSATNSSVPTSRSESQVKGSSPVLPIAPDNERRLMTIWLSSIALMVAGTTGDAVSSWHKHEANGLLASSDGTFGGRAIGMKVGVSAVILIPQLLLRHHTEFRKGFIIGNLADAALYGGTAIHNTRVK